MDKDALIIGLKRELLKRYYVEDGKEYIQDKKGFAYEMFNILLSYDPTFVGTMRKHWDYHETKNDF